MTNSASAREAEKETAMIPYTYRYLPAGSARYEGAVHDNAAFILQNSFWTSSSGISLSTSSPSAPTQPIWADAASISAR